MLENYIFRKGIDDNTTQAELSLIIYYTKKLKAEVNMPDYMAFNVIGYVLTDVTIFVIDCLLPIVNSVIISSQHVNYALQQSAIPIWVKLNCVMELPDIGCTYI